MANYVKIAIARPVQQAEQMWLYSDAGTTTGSHKTASAEFVDRH